MGSSLSTKTTLNLKKSCSVFHRQLCMAEGQGKSRASFYKGSNPIPLKKNYLFGCVRS